MTQEILKQNECRTLIFYVRDFLARHSQSLDEGKDLPMQEEPFSLKLPDWLQTNDLRIFSLKTYPVCFRMTKGGRFTPSSVRYLNWGIMSNGKCLTARISESPSQGSGCILSDILMEDVPEKYYLSQKQMEQLLYKSMLANRERVYAEEGLSCTLTSGAGGMGGKTGLYEVGIPIKENTRKGYKMAYEGDSIDLGYPGINSRRGRVGHEIAHTLTTGNQQGTLHFVDISPPPLVTDVARCLNTRQDSSIHNHRGESSGVLVEEPPRAVLTPAKEKVRQNGRRMKEPEEPMFTITATDRHGVIYHGRIRRLTPRECLRLQGYRDGQISKMEKETSDNQLYKQAGNGVTVNVIEAIGRNLKAVDEEIRNSSPVPEAKGG